MGFRSDVRSFFGAILGFSHLGTGWHVRQFFGVALELARPSEARCFSPGGDFFEAVLLQQPQATEGNRSCQKMLFFEDFRRHVRQFFWRGFGTSSSFRGTVFSPRQVIFSKLFYCSSRRQQKLSKKIEKNVVFLRISDDTLGSFLAWFWN